MSSFFKTAAAAVAAVFACAVAGAADFSAHTIRLAHTAAVSHAHHEAALQFAKNVSERTGGKVKVEVYPRASSATSRARRTGDARGARERPS